MFETKTSEFDVMNTPYGKDLTKDLVAAFRKQGIAIGFYKGETQGHRHPACRFSIKSTSTLTFRSPWRTDLFPSDLTFTD